MRVFELMAILEKIPAGARVFVETQKPMDELFKDNLSVDEEIADISFAVKAAGKREDDNDFIIHF